MAINFPSTAGQATDGSYTYTVAGIVYAWNGSSWEAAGAGASATDRTLFSVTNASAGSTSLSYNNSNGVFTYTPPDLSGYLTAEADTLASVTARGATTNTNVLFPDGIKATFGAGAGPELEIYRDVSGVNSYISDVGTGELRITTNSSIEFMKGTSATLAKFTVDGACELRYNNTTRIETTNTGATITGALTAGGLTYPTSNGSNGQVLTSDGAGGVTWTAGGLQSRATTSVTQSIANQGSADVSITTPSGYVLLSIATSHGAWVTLYSDTTSRTNDSTRAITNDPLPGSGVLAEVITTGNATQLITPGVVCFNSAGAGQNTTYAKIVNRSGSTNNIQVTLTYITIEA
tara:strand:+ start:9031 stop:10074 length:1044 start_codon:yes stop_codon:yes gene_type:complete